MLTFWRIFSRACQIWFGFLLSLWSFTWTSSSGRILITCVLQNWLWFRFRHSSKPRILRKGFFSHIVWSACIIEKTHIVILSLNCWLNLRRLGQVWLNCLCIAILFFCFWLLSGNFISFSFKIICLSWSENDTFRNRFPFKNVASWKLGGWRDRNSRTMVKELAAFYLWFLKEVGLVLNQVSYFNRCVFIWLDLIWIFLQTLQLWKNLRSFRLNVFKNVCSCCIWNSKTWRPNSCE